MTVVYLIDSLEGYGAEKSLVNIALNIQGVTPVFVHLYRGEKLRPTLEGEGVKVYSLNIPSEYNFRKACKLVSPIIEKEKPTIIHSTLFRAEMVARKLKAKFPKVILVGSFVSNSYGKYRYSQLDLIFKLKLFSIQLLDRFTAKKVDYFICNSEAIKISNSKALGVPAEKIKVIYRGRNFSTNCRLKEDARIDIVNNLQIENKRIFLNVGRLNKGKGQLDLLYAFKKLTRQRKDVVLLIAGEGVLRDLLEETIERLDLRGFVLLLGYREDVAVLLEIADFFVFPTYYEGLPGALIEAIIAKTPSIVSSIEENKECLPENAGLFFEPGDVPGIYLKMVEALEVNNWQERTKVAFENALNNFNIKHICREYETFYKTIANI